MSDKYINSRIQNKHDIEANWIKATNFTPLLGELIIYDIDDNYDYERFKIGDGVSNVNALPFVLDKILIDAKNYIDQAILGGEW